MAQNKAQTNVIVGIGMAVMVIWSLINNIAYVQDLGKPVEIRNTITDLITESEKAKNVFQQERLYNLERALLLTGMSSQSSLPSCQGIEAIRSDVYFPYLPTSEITNMSIYYWKDYSAGDENYCVPDWEQIGQTTDIYLQEMFAFLDPNKISFMQSDIESDNAIDMEEGPGLWRGVFSRDYLTYQYEFHYFNGGQVKIWQISSIPSAPGIPGSPNRGYLISETNISNHVRIENHYFFLSGPEIEIISLNENVGGNLQKCFKGLEGVKIFRSTYTGPEYAFGVVEKGWFSSKSIDDVRSELIVYGYDKVDWTGESDMCTHFAKPGDCMSFGGTVYINTTEECPDGKGWKFEQWYSDCNSMDCFLGFCEPCKFDETEISQTEISVGSQFTINEIKYNVTALDRERGMFILLKDASRFNIVPQQMYFLSRNVEFRAPDKEIGEISTDHGTIVYDFIPDNDEQICLTTEGGAYNVSQCVSILSRQVYSGGFADLYSYAKSFVAGEFPFEKTTVEGFMEYNIMRILKNVDAVVDAKTLKVMNWTGGEATISPKHDWRMSVINALGLDNIEYTWEDANEFCAEDTVYDMGSEPKSIEMCACDYNGGNCEPLLNNSIITEFRRIFEVNTPERLEALTTYPWTIRVKRANITVTNLCNGEKFSTFFENSRDYYNNSIDSMTVGIPMQFLFGEKSNVDIEGDPRWCDVNDATGLLGEQCVSGTGSLDVMCIDYGNTRTSTNTPDGLQESELGWPAVCTMSGVCCPMGYEDYLDSENVCCKLVETSACTDEKVTKKYECAVPSGSNMFVTTDVNTEEACQATAYGGAGSGRYMQI